MKPKPKSRASALLLATILLFAILTVIISLSSVTVMEMKMGQKGKTSVASFYDAESGVEWALNTVATGNGDIKSKFTPNSDGSITCPAGVGGAGCKVYFLKADGTAMTQAEINASSGAPTFADVRSVRSVGREGNDTQRAIEAAVAGSSSQSFALLQNRRSQGTGGGNATTGSWQTMPLNVEQEDVDGIVDSGSLPNFSLAAGTYRIEAISPFGYSTGNTQTRIYNVTDSAASIIGNTSMSFQHPAENSARTTSTFLIGTVTISGTKQFRLQYWCDRTSGNGLDLGYAANYGPEVYAQVMITKLN